MGSVLKSVGTIGGGLLGGVLGGPAGALVGGALGSNIGGVGNVNAAQVGGPLDARQLAAGGGFNGSILNPSGMSLVGNQIQYADPTIKGMMYGTIGGIGNYAQSIADTRNNLSPLRADLAQMRDEIRPGFSRLAQAKIQAIKDAGAESVGNLRESLARRNVLGSSFANDAMSREQMAIGREVERASAEATVQEFAMQLQRMGMELGVNQQDMQALSAGAQVYVQKAQALANQMDRDLQELAVAGNIRNGVNAQVSAQAMQMAQLQMLQQTTNAQLSTGASMANAGNKSDLSGLMLAGTMGMFGQQGSAGVMTPTNNIFGRGASGMLGSV